MTGRLTLPATDALTLACAAIADLGRTPSDADLEVRWTADGSNPYAPEGNRLRRPYWCASVTASIYGVGLVTYPDRNERS